ncbi:putative 2-oxo-4-hydroxy-4-carboxy-5-ureidoimidazoline decarboxylase [Protopterus annectens]|uniref:putative 2-oxo-4-hydroxy-4-carboxy-5-ureidoimidazoline decarboxylase n=1 Tax=Protopterus annectens TaxID=7888 RepID=UPI001CFA9114|nr:putative 2-oxo-4-hydroxy-4-carboxy-5-ureidoimidazoline decarboxylase [Protopterus annectens]
MAMDIRDINSMNYESFLDVFGNVVEKCPVIVAAIWSRCPFLSVSDMESSIAEFIDSLPQSGKEGILRCHPDLAGRDLLSGKVTAESQGEQRQAGLASLSPGEMERMKQLNSHYKNKFGFPFVICARMSNKAQIFQELSVRVNNPPSQELLKGIEEVKKICHLRIQAIVSTSTQPTKL